MRSIFSALIIFTAAATAFAQPVEPLRPLPWPPLINVSANGQVKVTPDEAIVQMGIEARDQSLEEAKLQHDTKLADVMRFLQENGVEAKDVQTDYVRIQPNYQYEFSRVRPILYIVERTLTVRLRDLSKFDVILTGLLKNGAQMVHNTEFRSTQLEKHQEEARQQALRGAKKKAEQIAQELGFKVGRVYAVEETGGGAVLLPRAGRFGAMMSKSRAMVAESVSAESVNVPSEFAIGQMTVMASVDVSFLIEQ